MCASASAAQLASLSTNTGHAEAAAELLAQRDARSSGMFTLVSTVPVAKSICDGTPTPIASGSPASAITSRTTCSTPSSSASVLTVTVGCSRGMGRRHALDGGDGDLRSSYVDSQDHAEFLSPGTRPCKLRRFRRRCGKAPASGASRPLPRPTPAWPRRPRRGPRSRGARGSRGLPSSSALKVTSTWSPSPGRGRSVHSGVSCQASRMRFGRSISSTWPQSHSLPSSARSYQRPPSRGSRNTSAASASAM